MAKIPRIIFRSSRFSCPATLLAFILVTVAFLQPSEIGAKSFLDGLKAKSSQVFADRAEKNAKHGDYKTAIQEIGWAIAAQPKDPALYEKRASYNQAKGNFQSAIRDYGKALQLAPGNMNFHLGRAEAYVKLGMKPEALADFQTVADRFQKEKNPQVRSVLKRIAEVQAGKIASPPASIYAPAPVTTTGTTGVPGNNTIGFEADTSDEKPQSSSAADSDDALYGHPAKGNP